MKSHSNIEKSFMPFYERLFKFLNFFLFFLKSRSKFKRSFKSSEKSHKRKSNLYLYWLLACHNYLLFFFEWLFRTFERLFKWHRLFKKNEKKKRNLKSRSKNGVKHFSWFERLFNDFFFSRTPSGKIFDITNWWWRISTPKPTTLDETTCF